MFAVCVNVWIRDKNIGSDAVRRTCKVKDNILNGPKILNKCHEIELRYQVP